MTKTFKISIPKFLEKQKKLDSKRQFIRLDVDIFHDPKMANLTPMQKLIYIFLLTKLDDNGELEISDKYIIKELDLDRRFDIEKSLSVISLSKLCTYSVQSQSNLVPKCIQNVQKKSKHIKDTHVEQEKSKESKEKDIYVKSRFHDSVFQIFNFYKKVLKRDDTYMLSEGRKQKVIARLKDPPMQGIEWAPDRFTQCQIAICQMSLSDYHQGANDKGKRYVDLANHCFPSREKLDNWIIDAIETQKIGQIRKYLANQSANQEGNHVQVERTTEPEEVFQ